MTVETTQSKIVFTGNGTVTEFAWNFPFFSKEDITVTLVDTDGTETVWTLGNEYTIPGVAPADFREGGKLVATAAPGAGQSLVVERILDPIQSASFRNLGAFKAGVHEDAFDKVYMILQSQINDINDALRKNNLGTQWDTQDLPFDKLKTATNLDMLGGQIDNVAPGVEDHQGVNLGQVKEIAKVGDGQPIMIKWKPDTITEGQTVFSIPYEFKQASVSIDGRWQHESDGAYTSLPESSTVVFSEGLPAESIVEFLLDLTSLAVFPGDRPGSRGNPFVFDTKKDLTDAGYLNVGDWAETLGSEKKYDGLNAQYFVVNLGDAGIVDGHYILDLGIRKGILMYQAPTLTGGGNNGDTGQTPVPYSWPYEWFFPVNETEIKEMETNLAGNSVGYGGSTYWNRPVATSRIENGKAVAYICDTYGTPEDREVDENSFPPNPADPEDNTLYINHRAGQAVIKLTRIVFDAAGNAESYSSRGLNDKNISYREDEHFQPAIAFNEKNGQIITGWGSRNSARTQDAVNYASRTFVKYGQSLDSLSTSQTIEWADAIGEDRQMGYSQIWFGGDFGFILSKDVIGDWWYVSGSGGQNYFTHKKVFDNIDYDSDPTETQSYLMTSWVDKGRRADPMDTDYSRLQIFMGNHPVTMADNKIYHARGSFIPANTQPSPRNGGGIFVDRMSDGQPVAGTTGRLGEDTFDKNDMDVAYTPAAGKATRLLDVAYMDMPFAIFAEFDRTDNVTHPLGVPYGTTWDLKAVRFSGGSWSSYTIKSGIRGMLGYNPSSSSGTGQAGKEGFLSGYVYSAGIHRGEDYTSIQPKIYVCGRDGNSEDAHYLEEITLLADFSAVDGSTPAVRLIENSKEILYRPEMCLGGPRRILFYNRGNGWSNFNSYVAERAFIDLTP